MLPIFVVFAFFVFVDSTVIGTCDTKKGDPSWLVTAGHGLDDWAFVGNGVQGKNYCFVGNKTAEILQVAYHVNIPSRDSQTKTLTLERFGDASNHTNYCNYNSTQIHYCVPFCADPVLETALVRASLLSDGHVKTAARLAKSFAAKSGNWVFGVIRVNLNANPEAHLVIQSFPISTWCSVYVGQQTSSAPYLYEMQAALLLDD
uniref:Cysteine proteinase inhibitor n=1 Tax=Panagrellus redivivus TaxID=6233 RepID=A0A7E4V4X1_PANRE